MRQGGDHPGNSLAGRSLCAEGRCGAAPVFASTVILTIALGARREHRRLHCFQRLSPETDPG